MPFRGKKLCSRSRKCGKENNHAGRCNTDRRFHAFWNTSRVQVINMLKRRSDELEELRSSYEEKNAKFSDIEEREQAINQKEIETGITNLLRLVIVLHSFLLHITYVLCIIIFHWFINATSLILMTVVLNFVV